jgi:hypothetical protein
MYYGHDYWTNLTVVLGKVKLKVSLKYRAKVNSRMGKVDYFYPLFASPSLH